MDKNRLPPGQILTEKFPVLHLGPVPKFSEREWDFKVFGLVEDPVRLSYKEFMSLPKTTVTADFHCVTTWSRFNNRWEGVSPKELLRRARPKPGAKFAMVHCDGNYTTNMPLEVLLDGDVLLAHRHDGKDLTPEHGWPLRLVVPKRYAYKSAKWVRGIELMDQNTLGFWELRGYSSSADPWKEERYSELSRGG